MMSLDPTGKAIAVTDFRAYIARRDAVRASMNLPLLDPEQAIKAAIRQWNTLLVAARTRLHAMAGRDLANNSFTYQIISREAAPALQAYFADLAQHDDLGRHSGCT
jgi:predicted transcriptional regulator